MGDKHDEYNLGAKIGSLEAKMDACITSINALTNGLGTRVQNLEAETNTNKTNIKHLTDSVSELATIVKEHEKSHWKWVGGLTAAFTGLYGMVKALTKFMHG